MDNKLTDGNPSLRSIGFKLIGMSACTIKWSCLYSGAGIPYIAQEGDEKNLKHNEKLCLLNCLYKKASPEYKPLIKGELKPDVWPRRSFNKEITPSTQAFAILSLCSLSELLYEDELSLGITLVRNAEIIYTFIMTHLRNRENLFITNEDKTKAQHRDIKLKPSKNSPKLSEQVYVFEALLYLHYITSKDTYMEYYSENSELYLKEARNIFNFLFENYHYLLELTSREIGLIISSLTRCCELEGDITQLANYSQLIALLCAEVETRIKVTGEVERNYNSTNTASLITHFRTASAFLEGASITGIRKFQNHSINIIDYATKFFDYSKGLFITGDNYEVSYSLRDITEILKALLEAYYVAQDEVYLKIITDFYNSSFEKSGIFPYNMEIPSGMQDINICDMLAFISPEDIKKAPVFHKGFKFAYKKLSTYNCSKHFNSEYALYSSYVLINYFSKYR